MPKISELFLLLLFLNNIQALLKEDQRQAIEIQIGSKVEYDKNRNYFQFLYEGSTSAKILFEIDFYHMESFLTYPGGKRVKLTNQGYKGFKDSRYENRSNIQNLTETGNYSLEIYCKEMKCEIGGSFFTLIFGAVIDTKGLSDNAYVRNVRLDSYSDYYGMNEYKVSNLNETKYVYFTYLIRDSYYQQNFYVYYPDDPLPPLDKDSHLIIYGNETIFEVYNVKENKSEKNVKLFKFEPNNEYVIKVHCLKYYSQYSPYYDDQYFYPEYYFFPITQKNFQIVNEENNFLFSNGPMLGLIQPNCNKNFNLMLGVYSNDRFLITQTDKVIELNLDNIPKIVDLEFQKGKTVEIKKGENLTTIFIITPSEYQSKTKMYLVNQIEKECKDSYSIPAGTSKMIYCEEKKVFEYFNHITTYISNKKTMHVAFSEKGEEEEGTDFVIQNYLDLPLFIEKSNEDQIITVKRYPPKFAFFGAENPFIFKALYDFGIKYFEEEGDPTLANYKNLTQTNIRINSKYLPLFEFYNFLFNQLDIKINLYIKQIYGGSELYECQVDDNDQKDLTFLTTPISNAKCKNKKSIFNRLFTLDGTKILSGYITPDSYFDIYAEIDKEDNKIDISPAMSEITRMNHASKYLRKNIEYNINFDLNHMVKLDPDSDAEVTLTKGSIKKKLNSKNPIAEMSGKGYTIKSDNDAMVYFLGKFHETDVQQKEIEIDKCKGKIVKLSNVDDDIMIDIGFEGYYPSSIPIDFQKRKNGIHYIENIYEKMKGKLVDGEKVYIYYYTKTNNRMTIEYVSKNLENKNNDFNIFLIPGNNEENTLVVNTYQLENIKTNFKFCKSNTNVKLSILGKNEEEIIRVITNDNYTTLSNLELFNGDNKISFTSNQPFIFHYSYYDLVDSDYFEGNTKFLQDRSKYTTLKIEEAKDKNNKDDVIKIKFKPNYGQSSTRYIIIIARKNSENTIDTFKDPCHITGLLNQRPSGVKVDTIYDIGDKDSIEAEVDIADILHTGNNYIVNIISQELRFEKGINFYEPLEFTHVHKNPSDSGSDDDGKGGLKGASLALAIVIPIIGVIIIVLIVVFCLRKNAGASSETIEKLNNNV